MATTKLPHDDSLEAFVERVRAADITQLQQLVVFGSVARETHSDESDIDILAVIDDEADRTAVEERLRDIAYDVMLEEGAVFSIHGVDDSTLTSRSDHPFFRRALSDGESIYG